MKWPWIARDVVEALADAHAKAEGALREQLAESARRNIDLVQRYDALLVSHLAYLVPTKTESTAAPMPVPALVPVERKLSRIAQTIREHAAGDTRLAAWLWDKARDLKAAGKDEAYIVERLTEWDSTEPEE